MIYLMIKYENKTMISGPHPTWQDSCLKSHGHIAVEMRLKEIAAEDVRAFHRHKAIQDEAEGWFSPFIPDMSLGMTFIASNAYSPKDILRKMSDYGKAIVASKTGAECTAIFTEAGPFIRQIPQLLQAKFSELYNTVMRDRHATANQTDSVPNKPDA